MPTLTEHPTLSELQRYVCKMEQERDFAKQTLQDKCLLLGEEVGELFKAVRKTNGLAMDPNSQVGSISDELADILIYLCAIANRSNIDLEQAFRDKEQKNQLRRWIKPCDSHADEEFVGSQQVHQWLAEL
ncbi:MazG nucleotide pyrophosphohydrolase domain-containing protein [Dongshaea marina]|uniref:MazG nucleotide pyrophosphohydrolase domain-containing protein n=1 Tax=Dongshaea marina TaxID=2047966 RepID=UPI000D3EDA1F|nr:MazG nucleotide pyrophosphohydrolase domain-containing protein [Dongshaea marina]